MVNKSVLGLLLVLSLFCGCEKKSVDSTEDIPNSIVQSKKNPENLLSKKFPLGDSEIKRTYTSTKGSITTEYVNPDYINDETMGSIVLGGKKIKLPATLEDLGDGFDLKDAFIEMKLYIIDDIVSKIIGSVNARMFKLTYNDEELATVYVYGYKNLDLKKCIIVYLFSSEGYSFEDENLEIKGIRLGDNYQNVVSSFGQPVNINDEPKKENSYYLYKSNDNNKNFYIILFSSDNHGLGNRKYYENMKVSDISIYAIPKECIEYNS